ncbi:MAG: gamma-glutamyl-gamma-aminobutyrate hydrolase family protein [Alphaproteobacteria bacterium]|nr:gamma-glutamyl-gamma-aminobutyrate hydrolase family protein [Alphaproteobacteria bacterium]
MHTARPLVGLPADTMEKEGLPFHILGDKYAVAVADVSRCHPLLIPSLGDVDALRDLVSALDGLVITGSPANVHPSLFGAEPTAAHEPYDHSRDATTLPLIELAIEQAIPLFCICRGHQELNVVMGGTVATEIQDQPGREDHRGHLSDVNLRYLPAHSITITPGGVLHQILGTTETKVNTVHRQAIDRLADGLTVEAAAADGTVEAVSIDAARDFALSVQWHPEYKAAQYPDSVKLFEAFGDAARARHARRTGQTGEPALRAAGV